MYAIFSNGLRSRTVTVPMQSLSIYCLHARVIRACRQVTVWYYHTPDSSSSELEQKQQCQNVRPAARATHAPDMDRVAAFTRGAATLHCDQCTAKPSRRQMYTARTRTLAHTIISILQRRLECAMQCKSCQSKRDIQLFTAKIWRVKMLPLKIRQAQGMLIFNVNTFFVEVNAISIQKSRGNRPNMPMENISKWFFL